MEKAPLTQCPSTCSNSVSNLDELTDNRRSITKGLWQGRSETWWKWFCVCLARLYDYKTKLLAPNSDRFLLPCPANGSQTTSKILDSRNHPLDSGCHWPQHVNDLQLQVLRGKAKFKARKILF
jgi:hypothetical protein